MEMKFVREVQITFTGDESLNGDTQDIIFNTEDFQKFGRALELMFLTKSNRDAVGIMMESIYSSTGLLMIGFVDAALACYKNPDNFVVMSVRRTIDS